MNDNLSPSQDADATESTIRIKLGIVGEAGFQALPNVLLVHQAELGLRSEDLNVLLNIMAHWYFRDRLPFPRTTTIAKRMGVSDRSVHRSIARLRQLGFVKRAKWNDRDAYDVSGLIRALEPFAEKQIAIRQYAKEMAERRKIFVS